MHTYGRSLSVNCIILEIPKFVKLVFSFIIVQSNFLIYLLGDVFLAVVKTKIEWELLKTNFTFVKISNGDCNKLDTE